jgi:glycosyltransferase involved in cell wall biosynthesis
MATFNRGHLLLDTLKSIQNQTFENFECLIIDDGSEDDTKIVLDQLLLEDNRFSYKSRPKQYKKGLPGCRNYGLDICLGDYVIFFDDDDIMHPQNLEFGLQAIKASGKNFCRFQRVTFLSPFKNKFEFQSMQQPSSIGPRDFYSIMTNQLPFNSCQILWVKKCFEIFRFNEDLMYAEEWECYLKIILAGFEGVNIENTLMYARKHPKSNTGEYHDGSAIRLNSHAEAIESLLYFIRNTDSWSFRVKKFLFNEYLRLKGHHIFVKLLSALVGPLESRFWQTYARLMPFRIKLYQMRKSFKTTS